MVGFALNIVGLLRAIVGLIDSETWVAMRQMGGSIIKGRFTTTVVVSMFPIWWIDHIHAKGATS